MPRDASELARRLARDAEAVCRHYLSKGRRQGRYWMVGDVRNTPGRSMYVRLSGPESGPGAAGRWSDAASAEHGDLLDVIRESCGLVEFREVAEEARRFLSLPRAEPPPTDENSYDSLAAAQRLWQRGKPLPDTHAHAYLRARGIQTAHYASLRFNAATAYRQGTETRMLPAMLAAVTRNDGTFSGILRTWLHPRSPAKASVASPRKALGRIHGHAVRFTPHVPGAALLVGEGIETVLSIVTALPTLPYAAALSAGSLAAFTPPDSVSHLIIAADNDPEGHSAADRLAQHARSLRMETTVILPQRDDFNEDLADVGQAQLAARLRQQLELLYFPKDAR